MGYMFIIWHTFSQDIKKVVENKICAVYEVVSIVKTIVGIGWLGSGVELFTQHGWSQNYIKYFLFIVKHIRT